MFGLNCVAFVVGSEKNVLELKNSLVWKYVVAEIEVKCHKDVPCEICQRTFAPKFDDQKTKSQVTERRFGRGSSGKGEGQLVSKL
jgi:hypothetical protein